MLFVAPCSSRYLALLSTRPLFLLVTFAFGFSVSSKQMSYSFFSHLMLEAPELIATREDEEVCPIVEILDTLADSIIIVGSLRKFNFHLVLST